MEGPLAACVVSAARHRWRRPRWTVITLSWPSVSTRNLMEPDRSKCGIEDQVQIQWQWSPVLTGFYVSRTICFETTSNLTQTGFCTKMLVIPTRRERLRNGWGRECPTANVLDLHVWERPSFEMLDDWICYLSCEIGFAGHVKRIVTTILLVGLASNILQAALVNSTVEISSWKDAQTSPIRVFFIHFMRPKKLVHVYWEFRCFLIFDFNICGRSIEALLAGQSNAFD